MAETIPFKEWQKFDIRVAKIKSVEPHPNADKLLVLKVDIGGEERQIVAGIKGHYSEKELKGKKLIMLTNLEPATLRGVKSDGMLLAAVSGEGKDEKVILLAPEKDIKEGAKVR